MDVNNINPALSSIVNVLTTMAGITPTIGKPSIKKDEKALGVVTGLIDLVGKDATGSLAISFSKPVALEKDRNTGAKDCKDRKVRPPRRKHRLCQHEQAEQG